LVIEAVETMRSRLETLLTTRGFEVRCFDTSAAGLGALAETQSAPYALILSSYAMPKMKGDQILARARETSPETFRILMADAAHLETMVSAINTARIHSCLSLPFGDDDLIGQVENCCRQYQAALKSKNLLKITHRQNRQLFQIASNFRRQEALDLAQMEKRKKQIRILESKLATQKGSALEDKIPSFQEILESKGVELSSRGFGAEFIRMKDQIKLILETAAFRHSTELNPVYYRDVVYRAGQEKQFAHLTQSLLPPIRMLIHQSAAAGMNLFGKQFKQHLDKHLQITFAQDRSRAFIQIKQSDPRPLDLTLIKSFLFWHAITHGIQDDMAINSWLSSASPEGKPFVIAQGTAPLLPEDTVIKYHFPTDFRHIGKVNEDGSINFRDRGEIPFVKENAFLAARIPPKKGTPGIDVTGHEILVRDPIDRTFEAGPGTRLSEDGNKIYAQIDGQPHLDAMGTVTICPELKIKGDLGFETGDVIFDGNVVVEGIVKQGFKVKGASLTAKAIEGAEIDLTGDLNVSFGIVDTKLVNVKGSVQAKYIHNSTINAFGDLIVQREIMDSTIHISGACINTNGVIIASRISANMGIDAGTIGTDVSSPSKLIVGVDEHTNTLVAGVDAKMRLHFEAASLLKKEISVLEIEDQSLHGEISQHAHVQDRAQLELRKIESKIGDLKASGNMAAYQKVKKVASQLKIDAAQAEEKITRQFERQDAIALEIHQKQKRIREFENLNLALADEKKRLLEFTARTPPLAQVKVGKNIRSGTKISGPNAAITLYTPDTRCRIMEIKNTADSTSGMAYYEMKLGAY